MLPVEDTFAHFLEAAMAHGSQPTVQVGGDGNGALGRIAYFKFDLRHVTGPISAARFHVVATNAGGGGTIAAVSSA